ncbi:MAG: bifunctional phosphoribosylaminoimidazolecarboxamide formyltransferase/IMP cyclohydrolase [Alphaproteobacteria bacterium]|nr:bifunctional phosphoribosylaminoimidazolecarboxamide formyltransferase/IMP cyclohydrolase [Alphaproteobacteria bacterium]
MSAPTTPVGPGLELAPCRSALLSVSDRGGLIEFARALAAQGVTLISTGGTGKSLAEAGLDVTDVAALTGFPEILDGRVKTLHPKVHGGILGRRDLPAHIAAMAAHGIGPIDLVVVNLYPFEQAIASGAAPGMAIENIDIGGPALIRAAAKNHGSVAVVVDPADYAEVAAEIAARQGTSLALRQRLAAKAFARTAAYDAAIAGWFAQQVGEPFLAFFASGGKRKQALSYGENPHQKAALYVGGAKRPGVASATQVQGKALSYNNLGDADAAYELVAEFAEPVIAIVKHANPCGVATAATLAEAYDKARACDPGAAFGGIVAANRIIDADCARRITQIFTEVVIAPDADAEARAIFAEKKNLRLLLVGGLPDPTAPGVTARTIAGGMLVQERDAGRLDPSALKCVTKRAPSEAELRDLRFAWIVCKHVRSNAIVFAKGGATVAIGAGQMSRVDSVRIAAWKAREAGEAAGETISRLTGAALASDAFFPFPDGLIAAIEAGATSAIQPGGSIKDAEVIAAGDARGLAMVLTGMRHFRH